MCVSGSGGGGVMVNSGTVCPTAHHTPFSSSSSAMTNTSACTFLYRLLGRSDWLTCLMCVCVWREGREDITIYQGVDSEPCSVPPFFLPSCHQRQVPTDLSRCLCDFQKVTIFPFNRCDFSQNPAASWRGGGVITPRASNEIRQDY